MNSFDEVCFERGEIEDYYLEDLVTSPDLLTKHLIEYRVRVLLKEDIIIYPGQEFVVKTACLIQKGVEGYCLHVMKNEKIPLTLLSDGYISELFTGRIVVKVGNYKSEKIKLSCGTEIAYIILNTFSLI